MEDYEKKENSSEEQNIELGDKIHIIGGRFDNTRGRIYYLDESIIRIMPDGVSDRLVELRMTDGYLNEEYGIEELFLVEKRKNPAFVIQRDYRVGQLAEAFQGVEGNPVGKYVIQEVNEKEDSIKLKDENDDVINLEFNFIGIPLETQIDVLRSREIPAPPKEGKDEGDEGDEDDEDDEESEELELGEDIFVEVPIFGEIKEIESTQRNYPDNVQRSDMLQDLISKLPLNEQKSESKIKEIRRLTELCLLLRNEIVSYAKNGIPSKMKETSYDTLLDLVVSGNNNFSKPVADVKRVMYLDKTDDNPTDTSLSIELRYLEDELVKENEYAKTRFVGNQNVASSDALPNWYIGWDKYNREHFVSWTIKSKENAQSFSQDREFFRAPYVEDISEPNVDGLPKVPFTTSGKKYIPVTADYVKSILFSTLRALRSRIGRLEANKESRLLESPDEADIVSYLLFPKIYERELGTIRSGKLAYDIGRSISKPRLMSEIINEQDGVSSIPTVNSILAVGTNKNVVGNVAIEDWLKNVPLVLFGLGDALVELKSYGFTQKEFSYEQQNSIIKKIETTIAHVKSHIQYVREKVDKEIEAIVFTNKNLVNETQYETLFTLLNSEPIIQQYLALLQKRVPFYRKNDVAMFAGLHYYLQNLLYATLAGYPEGLARFRNEFVNKQFVESLHEALLLSIKNDSMLYQPEINDCQHTKDLNTIRKVNDNSERMKLLSKFLTNYQAYKKDNYTYCIKCSKSCLCEHEYLLLQEYLHPREKETIHKELLVRFSGGVFQGKFICNNCGQAISDLEFDTSLEYSDDGVPLMGRSELVDKDGAEQDELELALGVPIGSDQEIKFDTPAKTLYYQKTREVFDRVGIFPEPSGYIFIVNGVDAALNRRPTREQYVALEKKRLKQDPKGKKALDYDTYINRVLIASLISYSIIELQTHIPNYIPRFSTYGCSIDLRGYPLGKEGDTRIIEFMACIVNTILLSKANDSSDDPWFVCRYLDERSDKKRLENIMNFIQSMLKEILIFSNVQSLISKKKEYIMATFGKSELSEGLQEYIPKNFTPFLYKEAEEIIIGDVANIYEKSRAYILETHKYASDTMKKELSPYAERTCCYESIASPLAFWKSKDLTVLPPKDSPKGPINSHSKFKFELRQEQRFEFNVSKEDYYKLFLKVCYAGERIGLPHEPGYNKICPYCGFKVPEITDLQPSKDESGEIVEAKGAQALIEQNIEINENTFQKLLNAVHLVNSVIPEKPTQISVGNELFQILYSITPSPFEDWRILLNETLVDLIKLDKSASEIDFAVAYGKISTVASQSLNELKDFIGENDKSVLEQMLDQPIRQVIESLETCILIPLIRVLKGYNTGQLAVPKDYNLDLLIITDINTFISFHTEYLKRLTEQVTGFAKSKIEYAVQQLSVFIKTFQAHVRIPLLLGGKVGAQYLLQAGIASILRDMVDPNVIAPTNLQDNTSLDSSTNIPKLVLKEVIKKYKDERFRLTDEEIRIEIAKRNEKEKMLIISKFDRMSKEEKGLELVKKKLGLGDWAVGGTKAIRLYNEDQYERDRIQRLEMGFVDFPQGQQQQEQQQQDQFYEQNAAYDTAQTVEDDY